MKFPPEFAENPFPKFIPVASGLACLRTLEGHTSGVRGVALTPDGRLALSGSRDKTLRLWDLDTGACLKTLEGHYKRVDSIALTPDGRRALSGSCDNTLRLWDLETGASMAVYQSRGNVTSLSAIKADGQFILGTSLGEVLHLRPINFPMDPPLVTPVRLWLWDIAGPRERGRWDQGITQSCLWYGQRSPVIEHILEVIRSINRDAGLGPDDSSCLSLPDEAWDEPRLLSECPLCKNPLRFNPFIVDNRDRH